VHYYHHEERSNIHTAGCVAAFREVVKQGLSCPMSGVSLVRLAGLLVADHGPKRGWLAALGGSPLTIKSDPIRVFRGRQASKHGQLAGKALQWVAHCIKSSYVTISLAGSTFCHNTTQKPNPETRPRKCDAVGKWPPAWGMIRQPERANTNPPSIGRLHRDQACHVGCVCAL